MITVMICGPGLTSLPPLGRLQHCRFLLGLQLLLRLLLGLEALLLLLVVALHAPLREGLVADELAVHALHAHLLRAALPLDTVAMILVCLVMTRVVLGLRHGSTTVGREAGASIDVVIADANLSELDLSQNG